MTPIPDSGWESPFSQPPVDPRAVRSKRIRVGIVVLVLVAAFAFAWG